MWNNALAQVIVTKKKKTKKVSMSIALLRQTLHRLFPLPPRREEDPFFLLLFPLL